jgi:hypothetical protein
MALTPLASSTQFNATAYKDLATHLQAGDLDATMLKATRACETATKHRLAPFTLTESHRLVDTDVEDGMALALPMPAQAQMNTDYARALGYSQLVRHTWVNEFPELYPDLWTGAITACSVFWAYQAIPYVVPITSLQYQADTGHVGFILGTFVPPGSTGQFTYTGGFTTVPDDLGQACIVMAASIILKSLDPGAHSMAHDPDALRDEAIELLDGYMRD